MGPPVSSTKKTDRHDITEILLKVVLSTIKQTNIKDINGVLFFVRYLPGLEAWVREKDLKSL